MPTYDYELPMPDGLVITGLVEAKNPLMARLAVRKRWHEHFVKMQENFPGGYDGSLAKHLPEGSVFRKV